MRTRIPVLAAALIVVLLVSLAILGPWSPLWGETPVIVGSTTTTQDTGILDVLQEAYRAETGVPIRIVVAGTGAILQQGRNGDLDVLLAHDRAREIAFVADGHGLWRRPVMHNDFVIVGPALPDWPSPGSPEELATNATAFMAALFDHRSEVTFVSRGDGSGTHSQELALWASAGVAPADLTGDWYKETGAGQAETLRVAVELEAYAVCDEATWNRLSGTGTTGSLSVVVRDPLRMRNQYGVIPVSQGLHPQANEAGGTAFAFWLTGPRGQAIIRDYVVGGKAAFVPNADDPNA
jgi:tungstate transport system substrate-binding protein